MYYDSSWNIKIRYILLFLLLILLYVYLNLRQVTFYIDIEAIKKLTFISLYYKSDP